MEEALVARLLADAGLVSLGPKVVWGLRPQGSSLPAIVLTDAAPGRAYTFKGATDLHDTLVQFDIWGLKFRQVTAIFRALLAEMETPKTVDEIEFGMAFLERKSSGSEDVPGIGSVRRISADFLIWWKQL